MAFTMDLTDIGRARIAQIASDGLDFDITHVVYGSSGFNPGTPATPLPLNPAATALTAEVYRKELLPEQTTLDTIEVNKGQETTYTSVGGREFNSILGEAGIIATITDAGTTGLSVGDEFLMAHVHFGRVVFDLYRRLAIRFPIDYTP